MYMPAGTTFVYMTYGMYHCINISSKELGAAVLLRALEPLTGVETMRKFRGEHLQLTISLSIYNFFSSKNKKQ